MMCDQRHRNFVVYLLGFLFYTTTLFAFDQNPYYSFIQHVESKNYEEAAKDWKNFYSADESFEILLEKASINDPRFRNYLLQQIYPEYGSFFIRNDPYEFSPTFGPELTFTNSEIQKADQIENIEYYQGIATPYMQGDSTQKHLDLWANHVRNLCAVKTSEGLPSCLVLSAYHKMHPFRQIPQRWDTIPNVGQYHGYEVHFPNGFVIYAETDQAALEFQTSPLTVEQAEKAGDMVSLFIFDACAKVGLYPHAFAGGGHIHIGVQQFTPMMVRNFIVDFFNHSHFWAQITGHTFQEAKTLGNMGKKAHSTCSAILKEDARSAEFYRWSHLFELVRRLNKEVYPLAKTETIHGSPRGQPALRFKYLNESTSESRRTLEIRSFRPQKSWLEFCAEIALLKARIELLRPISAPLELRSYKELEIGLQMTRVHYAPKKFRTVEQYYPETKSREEWLRYLIDLNFRPDYQQYFLQSPSPI